MFAAAPVMLRPLYGQRQSSSDRNPEGSPGRTYFFDDAQARRAYPDHVFVSLPFWRRKAPDSLDRH